ncbi:MAG TPA: nucleotide exchange factor GrpE [Dehalococcoidia bacterium]|nr:nucleotide exchange factor GrpE [Dehalococcoidia bacterium]HIK89502.1 nucleotide exchange factor GrpE [Dehalococcoidia bacterium]
MPDSDTDDKQPQDDVAEAEQDADSDAVLDFTPEANDELAEALREKEQFKKLAQRSQADLVNYRRRIEGEQESSRLRNQQRIVMRFADVIDQLDAALKSDSVNDADSGWLEGIEAVQKNFIGALAAEGFERFTSVGEDFDPRRHEALLSTPTADHEPNTVVSELRPGYLRNGEVVRPAQVQIAVPLPEDDDSDEDADNDNK